MREPCLREEELLAALERGFLGGELEQHLTACEGCRQLAQLVEALVEDRTAAVAEAAVPSAGTMWWRIQVRQRREAQATVRRSLAIGQALTLAVAIALSLSLFGSHLASGVARLVLATQLGGSARIAVAALIALAPLAAWMALRERRGHRP